MRKKVLLLLLFFTSISLFAQETVTVSGQLFDAETKEPLSFANVAVHTFEDNALVTGAITDVDGRFEILEIPLGKYEIYFSFVGYLGSQQTLLAGGLNTIFDLGKIELQPSA